MFDLGWSELFVVALVVLIVIGPRELPKAMRMVAKWVRKGRALAREFQSSLDDLARESDLDKVKSELQEFSRYDPGKELADAADPGREIEREFRSDPDMPTIDTTDDPDQDDDLLMMETAGDAPSYSSNSSAASSDAAAPKSGDPANASATAKPPAPAENTIASNSSPSTENSGGAADDGSEPMPEPAEPAPARAAQVRA